MKSPPAAIRKLGFRAIIRYIIRYLPSQAQWHCAFRMALRYSYFALCYLIACTLGKRLCLFSLTAWQVS